VKRRSRIRPAIHPITQPLAICLLALCLGSTGGGCAYGLRSGKLRGGLETVAVPFFENRSDEPNLEIDLTEAIIQALLDDRTLRVVDEAEADALVLGIVHRYRFDAVFFGEGRQAEEYEVNIEVEIRVFDRRSQETIAGPQRIRGRGRYYLEEGPPGEQAARDEAAQQIVQGILNLVVEDW
jgi:hypothetical protein